MHVPYIDVTATRVGTREKSEVFSLPFSTVLREERSRGRHAMMFFHISAILNQHFLSSLCGNLLYLCVLEILVKTNIENFFRFFFLVL
jgi:hypothetical protein